jgi:hypothetical protein
MISAGSLPYALRRLINFNYSFNYSKDSQNWSPSLRKEQ